MPRASPQTHGYPKRLFLLHRKQLRRLIRPQHRGRDQIKLSQANLLVAVRSVGSAWAGVGIQFHIAAHGGTRKPYHRFDAFAAHEIALHHRLTAQLRGLADEQLVFPHHAVDIAMGPAEGEDRERTEFMALAQVDDKFVNVLPLA